MRSDRAWLLDILDAIDGIARYRPQTRAAFDDDERTQVWMVNRLQIIGEACGGLSEEFRARHCEIPWRAIIGMRHHLVHGYFSIDPDIVWSAITERVPELDRDGPAIPDTSLIAPLSPAAPAAPRVRGEHGGGGRGFAVPAGGEAGFLRLPVLVRGERRLAATLATLPTHSRLSEGDLLALEQWAMTR